MNLLGQHGRRWNGWFRQLRDGMQIAIQLSATDTQSSAVWVEGQRVIVDRHLRLSAGSVAPPFVDTTINKEQNSRDILFSGATPAGNFVEIGSGDGRLAYLLGIRGNFDMDEALYEENRRRFDDKFRYVGLDLASDPKRSILAADICSGSFLQDVSLEPGSASVVYSNNVFEHLRKPWIAARNVYALLKVGGVCITIVPFAQRYHESPGDFFRYTHTGIASLFEDAGSIQIITAGYDILGRRNDWQGGGLANDTVPVDAFGAWRETWFTFLAFRKLEPTT